MAKKNGNDKLLDSEYVATKIREVWKDMGETVLIMCKQRRKDRSGSFSA